MKNRIRNIPLFVFLISALSSLAFSQTTNHNKAEQELLKARDVVIAALLKKDFSVLDHAYTTDCILTPASGASMPQARWLTSFKTSQSGYDAWEKAEEKFFFYGDTAIINARYKLTSHNSAGKSATEDLRCTTTWVKQKGRWLIAASQFTVVKPPTAPPAQ